MVHLWRGSGYTVVQLKIWNAVHDSTCARMHGILLVSCHLWSSKLNMGISASLFTSYSFLCIVPLLEACSPPTLSPPTNGGENVSDYEISTFAWYYEFLLLVCGNCGTTSRSGSKIVAGSDATLGEIPWQVGLDSTAPNHSDLFYLIFGPSFFCGGSLINANWVLSAAHCTVG